MLAVKYWQSCERETGNEAADTFDRHFCSVYLPYGMCQAFAEKGIALTDVDRITIGLGTKGNMTVPGGSGKIYIDDIRLYRTREAVE